VFEQQAFNERVAALYRRNIDLAPVRVECVVPETEKAVCDGCRCACELCRRLAPGEAGVGGIPADLCRFRVPPAGGKGLTPGVGSRAARCDRIT